MRKILIVEDDKFLAAIFSLFIKDLGYKLVGRCEAGDQALELCKIEKPDVVLMDIHLEGEIDGIETAERIQREFEIPVIFVTSDTSSYIVERAIISNSYGYLVKPVKKNELGISIDLAYYKHKVAIDQKRREQSFRQFLSEAPVPIVIVQKGLIQYLNINALKLFHTHYIEDIMGMPFINFIPPDFQTIFQNVLDESEGASEPVELTDMMITGFHGKPLDVTLNGSWVTFNGESALQLILIDITAEKKAVRDCRILRDSVFKSGNGVMVINSDMQIEGLTQSFSNLFNIDKKSKLRDIDIDPVLIKKIIDGEENSPQQIKIKAGKLTHRCTAIPIGRVNYNREVIIRVDA